MDAVQARAREPREAERDQKDREAERADRQRDQEMAAFDQAYSQMDAGRWDRAVEAFARVAAMKGTASGRRALLEAYSQDRIGQRAEALATIAELAKTYPASRYVKQAQALEMEVRRNVGQPANPEAQGDEELKLIAINSLLNSDPEKALPDPREAAAGRRPRPAPRARGVRPGAEQLAARPRDPEEPRARSLDPGAAEQGDPVPRRHGRRREPGDPGRGLHRVHRRRRQAPHSARLHGLGRQAAAC